MMGGGVKLGSQVETAQKQYFKVPANLYQPSEIIDQDLYLYYQGQHLLFRPKNLMWSESDRQRLEDFGVKHLFIQCHSTSEHYEFLEKNLSRILLQDTIDSVQKSQVVYETSQAVMSDIFSRPQSTDNVKRSVGLVKNSIDFLKDQDNFLALMKLASTDFSEYTHAIQVSAYSIALAKEVGLKSFNELSAIGIGSILHDIGKTKVPRHILEKKDALDESERREVEKHPEYGYEILQKQRSIPEVAEMIVLQHHERPSGQGYPYRLGSDMICSAKIVAITDCFDCLTSDRPFKPRMKPFEAIQFMRTECADQYDHNILTSFIRVLGIK